MARDKFGIVIAAGLGDLKHEALRIGHLGMTTVREALLVVSVLEMVLFELGYVEMLGKGLETFSTELNRSSK